MQGSGRHSCSQNFTEEREYAPLVLVTVHAAHDLACANLHVVGVLEHVAAFGGVEELLCVTDGLGTEEHCHVVFAAECLVVVGGIRPCPGVALAVGAVHAVGIFIRAVGLGIEGTVAVDDEVLAVLYTDVRLEEEAVDGTQAQRMRCRVCAMMIRRYPLQVRLTARGCRHRCR